MSWLEIYLFLYRLRADYTRFRYILDFSKDLRDLAGKSRWEVRVASGITWNACTYVLDGSVGKKKLLLESRKIVIRNELL